jgi:restriction endonuclease S subunit
MVVHLNQRIGKKKEDGGLPIIRIQNLNNNESEFNYYSGEVDEKLIINEGDLLFSWSGSRGTSFGPHIWSKGKAILNQHIFKVNHYNSIIKKYFYYALKVSVKEVEENLHGGVGLVHITKGNFEQIQIPLPPLEIQEQIVAELDGYQNIITGAKQIIANWKPTINIEPTWKIEKLEKHIELISGQHIESEKYSNIEHGSPYITGPADFGDLSPIITKWTDSPKVFAKKNDILMTVKGSGIGRINLFLDDCVCISRQIMAIRPKDLETMYLYYLLFTQYDYFQKLGEGCAIPGLTRQHIENLFIPLPPLEIQQQIVERIESERTLVESAKKLIQIYEQKTKTTLAKLWED